ncbi:MAG: ankyrin repeat domain-containing protein [Ignavibacteria bacterium]|nr:ankyrin repeat domain-containing protein [Ignavibacteria bacterium]
MVIKDGRTALHWAVSNGNYKIVSMLLTAGADDTLKNKVSTTQQLCTISAYFLFLGTHAKDFFFLGLGWVDRI